MGSHLTDAIAAMDPPALVVADSFFLGKRENLGAAAATYRGLVVEKVDVSDLASIEQLVDDHRIEVVFDLATMPLPYSLEYPHTTIEQNVMMAANLAELARRGAYQTLVHFSTSEVYGTAAWNLMTEDHPLVPLTPYASSKAAADHIVESYVTTYGIDALIVRPFNNYGPRQNDGSYAGLVPITIKRALADEPVTIFGDGSQARDFMFVRDTVEGALAAYGSPGTRGHVVNLATGIETTVNEVVNTIFEILDMEPNVIHSDPRPGDVARHCGSADFAFKEFGFKPETSLRDGLGATVEWYRGNGSI